VAVGVWVKNARKGIPDIGTPEVMEKEWWAWWKGINPGGRLRGGELQQDGDGSWLVLRCPGQNGFLNIIACLRWWFASMETPSEGWRRVVLDVKWVLGKMIEAYVFLLFYYEVCQANGGLKGISTRNERERG
jgi:hypothetical protein